MKTHHMLLLLFLSLQLSIHFSLTSSSIPLGSSLLASQHNVSWSSPNFIFSVSFLPVTPPTSPPTFLAAVAYDGGVPVWTIGSPVDSAASLRLLSSGSLRLFNGSGVTLWDSATDHLGVASASLDDFGNFVLLDNRSVSVWSSFDNPVDTILPSQNFTTGKALRSESYSFALERNGNVTLKWNNRITYWNLGLNSSIDANLSSPRLGLQSNGVLMVYDRTIVGGAIVVYSNDYAQGSDILRFLRLDKDGNLRIYSSARSSGVITPNWAALSDQCQVFGYCGDLGICTYKDSNPVCECPSQNFEPVDFDDKRKGCKRKVDLNDCPASATMLNLNHTVFLTYPPESSDQIFFSGITLCRGLCLSQRADACIGSTSLSDGTGTCYLKPPGFVSGYQNPALPSSSFVKVCDPVLLNPSGDLLGEAGNWKLNSWVIALVVVASVVGLIALEGGLWCWCCRNSSRFGRLSAQYALLEYASGAPVQFSYKELSRCTKGFKHKLGEGGFGAVYRGVLANKTIVAVKQLEGIEQGEKQFRMEVATISSTHHLNLVRLIGFCSEGRHRLLVYEFMKNGSLDNFIFDQSGKLLSWENRFNIAVGTARGITYLHEECRDCIVHCDMKPENILLDENYSSKVSDFGLAKLISPKDHNYKILTSVRGTRGYLAPEWIANLPITSKSDVYSYGMVLLEIASGKRNFEVSAETNHKKFSLWAYEEFDKGNLKGIVDKRLLTDQVIDMEQVMRVILVSFWCIQEQPSQRPTMGKVVQMLEGVSEIARPPPPKAITNGFASGSMSDVSTFSVSAAAPSSSSASGCITDSTSSYFFGSEPK